MVGVARGHPAPVDTSLAGSLAPGKSVGVARTDNDHRVASAAAAVAVTFCVRLFRPHWLVAAARGVSCRSARRSRDTPSSGTPWRGHLRCCRARGGGRCSPGERESAVYGRGSQLKRRDGEGRRGFESDEKGNRAPRRLRRAIQLRVEPHRVDLWNPPSLPPGGARSAIVVLGS